MICAVFTLLVFFLRRPAHKPINDHKDVYPRKCGVSNLAVELCNVPCMSIKVLVNISSIECEGVRVLPPINISNIILLTLV